MSDAELRKEAKRAYKAKDFAGAAELYGRLVEPPGSGEELSSDRAGYAAVLANLGRLDEAAVQLEQVVAASPGDAARRHKLGEILSRLGRHSEALDQLAEAARIEPQAADHHWRIAVELRTLGREREAQAALQSALALNPNHTEAQIFQLEQVLASSPERDGQFAELETATGGVRDFPASSRVLLRQTPVMIAVEAVLITGLAVWLRSLMA
ncbi:MAG: hypothetical protein B7Y99_03055 [Caulobacterales bacterium 32-69-10]|nr:MAG: hypothetical protein B7Y99_03055 [Caulobacterales bacterium 32-69-10]